jgi:hypothetical protein
VEERVVATRDLGTALDDVAGDHATRQLVVVGARPSVVPGRRTAGDRSIGDPAGDHDVGALGEGVDDTETAEIGVGGEEAGVVAEVGRRPERLQRPGLDQFSDARHQVVTIDVGDRRRQPEAVGDLVDGVGATVGVEAPGVGHDLDATVEAGPHHLFHLRDERPGESSLRVLRPDATQDQHGQLGEPVAGQHVDRPALDHLERATRPIAEESGTVRDADRLGHVASP